MSTTETPTALAGLVGEWEGTVRTWFEPGQLAGESPMRARIRSLGPQDEEHPGGGFVLYEYSGTMQGQPCEGVAIVGWDETKGQRACQRLGGQLPQEPGHHALAGPRRSGPGGPQRPGALPRPQGGPDWGWRTEFRPAGRRPPDW